MLPGRNGSIMSAQHIFGNVLGMVLDIIQIIDQDFGEAALLDRTLRKARYRTNVAMDGQLGLDDVKRLRPALVLLNLALPTLDGLEVYRRVRADPSISATPIILLSDRHETVSSEFCLDDRMAKPISPDEVLSRVGSALRRKRADDHENYSTSKELTVLERRVIVDYRSKRLDLPWHEWRLLKRLADAPGEVVSVEELVADLWGQDGLIHEHELRRQALSLSEKLNHEPLQQIVLHISGVGCQLFPSF